MIPRASPDGPDEILIVEDSATQALQLRHLLEKHGYRVRTAGDGRQAIEQLSHTRPALIVSDIVMPGMDGHAMCHAIKQAPALRDIPVVLLTCLSDPHDVIRGLQAGADAFATKPYKEASLLRRVRDILANRRSQAGAEPGRDTGVVFGGQRYALTGTSRRIVEFLLYTYEDAVERNLDLIEARDALSRSNRDLESYAEQLRQKNTQMEDELRMARGIQQAFLPRQIPSFPAGVPANLSCLGFAHVYQPSATLGGDFFDVLPLSQSQAGVFICDVIGHGVRAALVTAIIRGLVEDLLPAAGDPALFLTELNRGLASVFTRCDDVVFASSAYAVVDVTSGDLRYANAGHPHPFRLRPPAGEVELLCQGQGPQGPALGLFADTAYDATSARLDTRDLLVFFTDGLYEAKGPKQEEYGQQRLEATLKRDLRLPRQEILDRVLEDVHGFTEHADLEDDVCLVAAELSSLNRQG
jgi:serine phosphatase RsbU (regulator of sigma subunit)/CheY-like chemotaxis protein